MLVSRTINYKVVEEDLHENKYVFAEDFCDDALKCCG